jgi:hypothetical protein
VSTALLVVGCLLVIIAAIGESAKPIAFRVWAIGAALLVIGLVMARWS